MKLLLALLLAASSVFAAPVPQWGPVSRPLVDGAFAKEGLDTDNTGRSFSVGYETPLGDIHALLSIRDAAAPGAIFNTITAPSALMGGGQASCYAGVDAEANGTAVFAVGTHFPTGINGPATRLLVTKWTPLGALLAVNTMAAIPGLAGQEVWGCRVVISPIAIQNNNNIAQSVIFVSGCTEKGMFLLCLDKNTLVPTPAWGNNGAFSVATTNGCPKHPMPGIFPNQTLFASCRQSFFEISGVNGFLGGTLINQGGNYEHTVAKVRLTAPMAGFLVTPFLVQRYTVTTNSGLKAMAVAGMSPATAVVTLVGGGFDSGWRSQTGLPAFASQGLAFAGAALMPAPQTMNDVEMQPMQFGLMSGVFIHIGGKHNGGNGGGSPNGQVFTFWCPTSPPGAPAFNWSVNYGSPADPVNEVYDLAAGGPANLIFATGGTKSGLLYDTPLLEITLPGVATTGAAGSSTWPDRGNAALYHAGGTVFTHGNQQSVGPALWYGRNVRWNP